MTKGFASAPANEASLEKQQAYECYGKNENRNQELAGCIEGRNSYHRFFLFFKKMKC